MPHWDRLIDCVQAGRFEQRRFSEWRRNTEFLRIDGSVSQPQGLIDRFNRPGAKFHLLVTDALDDPKPVVAALKAIAADLPAPKPKKPKS